MKKACSRCGKIHDSNYKCNHGKVYQLRTDEHNTHKWHKKSEQVRSEAMNLCEVCKAEGKYTYDNLEVHHIVKIKDNKDLLLEDSNLICLCQFHHRLAETGQLDQEYLRELAMQRITPVC